jgi:Zn-dependent protease with chaperone function
MADHDATDSALVRALPEHLEVPGVSAAYRLGAALVALLMVLLPLLYLAFIVAIGWAVWWHATENAPVLAAKGNARGRLAAYIGPIFIGVVLVLFLVKPLFAPRPKAPQPLVLKRGDQPLLFVFVDKLCDAIGAPRPLAIHADCDLNASAGFHSGGDLVRGGRVLTVGLPLMAGMSLVQFAGVLAHEFGHFAQGTGTRLSWLIHSVNRWFARVVYERDAWDARLDGLTKVWGWTSWIALLAKGCIWLTRRVLFGLMYLARAVSCYLSRQMEFDADRYQTALIGPAGTESAFRRLAVLGPLWGHALRQGWSGWDQRRLPADLPAFLHRHDTELKAETRHQLEASMEQEEKELFATHPRLVERIATSRAAGGIARFATDQPATSLLRDFDAVARDVTRRYFEAMLGPDLRPEHLLDPEALWAEQARDSADYAAMRRFSQNMPSRVAPLHLVATAPPQTGEALRARLQALRQRIASDAGAQDQACGAAVAASFARDNAEIAGVLLRAKVKIDPAAFGLDGKDQAAVDAARRRGEAEWPARVAEVRRLQAPLEERWSATLGLLAQGTAAGLPAEAAALADESRRLLAVLAALAALEGDVDALRSGQRVLDALLRNLADLKGNEALQDQVLHHGATLADRVRALMKPLEAQPYPFAHGKGQVSIAAHADAANIPPRNPVASVDAAGRLLAAIDDVYVRCLSRLAVAGEAVESALGLEPLAEPAQASA